jgi:hypothetical protein
MAATPHILSLVENKFNPGTCFATILGSVLFLLHYEGKVNYAVSVNKGLNILSNIATALSSFIEQPCPEQH